MLVTSSSPNVTSYDHPFQKTAEPHLAAFSPSPDGRPRSRARHFGQTGTQAYRLLNRPMVEKTNQGVEVHPADIVKRHVVTWDGMAAEIVHATRRERMEFRFRGARHLLVLCEQGVRSDGDTFVEGLPRSTLRDVTRKLTFVPAGRTYHEWHEPRVLTRLVYFYFDPARLPLPGGAAGASTPMAPRLLFEDATLSST